MENKLTKREIVTIINDKITDIVLSGAFDPQSLDYNIQSSLYYKALIFFVDSLDEHLPADLEIMTQQQLKDTLDNLSDKMWDLLGHVDVYFDNAFADAVNSQINFTELL